jgi:membrane protein DedA with SNARE-associated domain
MYGMRTIIPISIGLTRYDSKKFAIINLFSAWCWASVTIMLAWYFGQEIIQILKIIKQYWYLAIPVALGIGGGLYYYFHAATKK